MKRKTKNAFTLVELLAVIVILAIILVIAVPKVMSVIEDSKKATLESTAKMIASSAEKQKVQNTVLGNTETITCDSVAKVNNLDYESCSIEFDDNTAKVTIVGKGKFAGLYVCGGTKTNADAINDSCPIAYGDGDTYIANLLSKESELNNGLVQTTAEYEGTTYDAGIRYVGALEDINNKVYYNCEDKDTNGVSYGEDNYDYASSCEVWRIIGVFDTKSSTTATAEKRIKIINTESTFKASWDSSDGGYDENWNPYGINGGEGINQWGESTLTDGSAYAGADLMQLLNGYYIGKEESTCTYCNGDGQGTCSEICTSESLKVANMKVLTSKAKSMIENAVWDTYAVDESFLENWNASTAYLQEKGINLQYTGKSECDGKGSGRCNDEVIRTTSWIGLVGLVSVSDKVYSNNWLNDVVKLPSTINPYALWGAVDIWVRPSYDAPENYTYKLNTVFPSVYLKSNIKIIDGNGDTEPYKLSL